jgi:myo-inositol 2-dehydrogenase/D-chiro-inositol 1-dehydrogenase
MRSEGNGLAVVGCGTVGRIRSVLAREHPAVDWLGLCDIDEGAAHALAEDTNADFVTTDLDELLSREEVTAVVVATAENEHVTPIMSAVDLGVPLFIEKPLATDPVESARVLSIIEDAGIDAVIGYTQRFRRRFQTVKQRLRDGQIGDVTSVVTRAFMNRMVPDATLRKTSERSNLTPMVVSGTHSLDMCMADGAKEPGRGLCPVYRQGARRHGHQGLHLLAVHHGRRGDLEHEHQLGTAHGMARCRLRIGDRDRWHPGRHRHRGHPSRRDPGHRGSPAGRVHLQGLRASLATLCGLHRQLPPGDVSDGMLWGPMREETMTWFHRLSTGIETPHASARDGHRNLILTMAMDRSARTGRPVSLPIQPEELLEE